MVKIMGFLCEGGGEAIGFDIPGQGTKILRATWHSLKINKNNKNAMKKIKGPENARGYLNFWGKNFFKAAVQCRFDWPQTVYFS